MFPHKKIFSPPVLSNRSGINQSFDRSGITGRNNSRMANKILVLSFTNTINTKPVTFALNPKLLERSDQRTPSFSGKQRYATPGMDNFKQKLFTKGISKESVKSLITNLIIKNLTLKLTMFLASISAARASKNFFSRLKIFCYSSIRIYF